MVNYKNSLIYTIRTGDSIYVGSTCNFNRRKQQHKENIYNENNKSYNLKVYKKIRENDGEWDMKPYKEVPCENKTQLTIEEEKVRVELNADLNMQSCHGLDKERRKKATKKYYEENQEKIKEYYEENQEKIKKYREENKEKTAGYIKKYREENKEKLKEGAKKYYEENKEQISKKQAEIVICECGCQIRRSDISIHRKTKKHIKLMEKKPNRENRKIEIQ